MDWLNRLLERHRLMKKYRARVRMSKRPEWRGSVTREGFCERVIFGNGKLGLVIDGNRYDATMTDFLNPMTPNCEGSHVRFKSWMHVWPPNDFSAGGSQIEAQIIEKIRQPTERT